jgi:hypothetical protein
MSEFKKLDKKVKKMDVHDIQLTKLSVAAFVLFILTIWPAAMEWVAGVHWGWFLAIGILAALRPMKRFFS